MNKDKQEKIKELWNKFLDKQAKESEYGSSIKDAFTRFNGWNEDYHTMLDFLYKLIDSYGKKEN